MRTLYDTHGRKSLGNRIEADYDALTGDDELVYEETVADIESDGIDADELLDSMVSWGTMRTHVTDCLGGQKHRPQSESDWQRESISRARSQATSKAEEAVSSLVGADRLDDGEGISVDVEVRLRCDHCPTVVPFDVALRRGFVCETHSAADMASTTHQ
jgi:hypothetical protein